MHQMLYGPENANLNFVKHLADYQTTSKGQITKASTSIYNKSKAVNNGSISSVSMVLMPLHQDILMGCSQ